MNISRDLLSINSFSRPGKRLISVKGIVIHWVENAGSTALQNRNYFEGLKNQIMTENSKYASAHFVIGLTGEIIQCIPLSEMAYHVGAKLYTPEAISCFGHFPNACTLGIELCHPDKTGKFATETWCSAVQLTAHLLKQYQLNPFGDIWMHYGINPQKKCPKYFVDNPEAFERFKLDVDIAMGENPEGV